VRIVIDTNVLISGAFYPGPSSRILDACIRGEFQIVVSPDIIDEYTRVGEEFTRKRPNVPFAQFRDILISTALFVQTPPLPKPVCEDPDDDKFIACALAGDAKVITSGDKHLLAVSGYAGIEILRPRRFTDEYLYLGNIACTPICEVRHASVQKECPPKPAEKTFAT